MSFFWTLFFCQSIYTYNDVQAPPVEGGAIFCVTSFAIGFQLSLTPYIQASYCSLGLNRTWKLNWRGDQPPTHCFPVPTQPHALHEIQCLNACKLGLKPTSIPCRRGCGGKGMGEWLEDQLPPPIIASVVPRPVCLRWECAVVGVVCNCGGGDGATRCLATSIIVCGLLNRKTTRPTFWIQGAYFD